MSGAWQAQEQTCYCPGMVKSSRHVSSDIKSTWSKKVVKVSIGVIHTTRTTTPSTSNVSVANRRDIAIANLPPTLLCHWLHPCEAWELFDTSRGGCAVTDYLAVSVEIDLKASEVRVSPFETRQSSDAVLKGIMHNLRRITRAMADMVDDDLRGLRLVPVLNITIDASNTPECLADELCRFIMGFFATIPCLAVELVDRHGSCTWYDSTIPSIIDINIQRLRMANCGLEAFHLTQQYTVDHSWVSKLGYHVELHHLDLSSNRIDFNVRHSESARGRSLLSLLYLVCGTIREVDISWNPLHCAIFFRHASIISPSTKVIGTDAMIPLGNNITKPAVPSLKVSHTAQLIRQKDHTKSLAYEWEGILTALLSSKIAETLRHMGLERHNAYIRVFGSALSGFNLPANNSDIDAVVLLQEGGKTIDAGLIEGKSSRWYQHSQTFVKRLHRRLPRKSSAVYGKSGYEVEVSEVVARARVPILKMKLTAWNQADRRRRPKQTAEIDLSFMNSLGVKNSELLREYGRLHCCVTPVVLAVKAWAKGLSLVSSMENNFQRLSSYAWTIMVIFYLQVRVGLLPSLQRTPDGKARKGGSTSATFFYDSDDETIQAAIFRREICPHFHDFGPDDTGQLFAGFFRFYGLGEFSYRNPIDITTAALQRASTQVSRSNMLIAPIIKDPFLREKDLASNCRDWSVIHRQLRETAERSSK